MGTKIVSTEGAGLDGRGGTYTGLVRLRRTTVLSYYAGRYVWMQGTAEYEEQGVQWRGSLMDQGGMETYRLCPLRCWVGSYGMGTFRRYSRAERRFVSASAGDGVRVIRCNAQSKRRKSETMLRSTV